MAQIILSAVGNMKTSEYIGRSNKVNDSSYSGISESKHGINRTSAQDTDDGKVAQISMNIEVDDTMSLNVGGKLFQCKGRTLKSRECGLLSQISPEHESYNAHSGSYFFDRNPKLFEAILEFYRTGKLHIKQSFCAVELGEEMKYWQVDADCISDCCWRRFCDLQEERSQNCRVMREFTDVCQSLLSRMKGLSLCRERLWVTLDVPFYSKPAKGIEFAYLLLVLLSFLTSCTFLYLQDEEDSLQKYVGQSPSENSTLLLGQHTETSAKTTLAYVEIACLSVVTPFVLIRAVVCPDKFIFWTTPLNILDILYLLLSWPLTIGTCVKPSLWHSTPKSVKITRFLGHIALNVGVLRGFRAARYRRGVRELWYAIRASCREVKLLLLFVLLSAIIFGTVFHSAENYSEAGVNIFLSFWWALVTMTTLGYGDIVPTVPAGYIVATMCALIGVVMISLPIPFIAHNFRLYYGYKSRFRNRVTTKL